jgi:hypothetical protein
VFHVVPSLPAVFAVLAALFSMFSLIFSSNAVHFIAIPTDPERCTQREGQATVIQGKAPILLGICRFSRVERFVCEDHRVSLSEKW